MFFHFTQKWANGLFSRKFGRFSGKTAAGGMRVYSTSAISQIRFSVFSQPRHGSVID